MPLLLPLVTGVRAVCDSCFPLGPFDLGRRRFIVDVCYFEGNSRLYSSELISGFRSTNVTALQ
jgi:hypothetical protein